MRSITSSLAETLKAHGISRRRLVEYGASLGSLLALPPGSAAAIAAALEKARRPSLIWLSFQECTGCTESLTRSHTPTLESLILDTISLDYHHTLQAASGTAAEDARTQAMQAHQGEYLLAVDGSIPLGNPGYSTIAGRSNASMLEEAARGAKAVIAVGSCAAFGGIAMAAPNPTGAVPVSELVKGKPVLNLPGCPPIPVAIAGVLAHFLTFGRLPELDALGRPRAFYGDTIHDRCYRRSFYDRGQFAETFDDEGARRGWCLFKLGCKGPTTHNACATVKWNQGVSFPIQSGHGCIGCSEPHFWDAGGLYQPLSAPTRALGRDLGLAAGVGVATGAAMLALNRRMKATATAAHVPVTIDDLEKKP